MNFVNAYFILQMLPVDILLNDIIFGEIRFPCTESEGDPVSIFRFFSVLEINVFLVEFDLYLLILILSLLNVFHLLNKLKLDLYSS